ncbi:MAG: exodeoxyribonuclease VII small subunit [Nitrososphaerales archaeon]
MENEKIEDLSFEEAYSRLEEVLKRMEDPQITLEESIKLFKTGVALYKRCKFLIDSASLSVKEVLGELEKEMKIDEEELGR